MFFNVVDMINEAQLKRQKKYSTSTEMELMTSDHMHSDRKPNGSQTDKPLRPEEHKN
jgi:hypothetical protein